MKEGIRGRKVSIVFEESGGQLFMIYLEGAPKGVNVLDDGDDLSPADFYATRMFALVLEHLRSAQGVKETEVPS